MGKGGWGLFKDKYSYIALYKYFVGTVLEGIPILFWNWVHIVFIVLRKMICVLREGELG